MGNFLKKIIGDKKAWKEMEARAKVMPRDYQVVYGEIKKYLWKYPAGTGMDTVSILEGLLGLFETGSADGKNALEITGEDVAAFCDELLKNTKTYTGNWREALNRDVMKKIGSGQK
ncbi:MAG: DUF1048 domain-containing protein [Patescibacteria group bacterium]|jgi:DNA-binding ferritin-like protein (Dps family)